MNTQVNSLKMNLATYTIFIIVEGVMLLGKKQETRTMTLIDIIISLLRTSITSKRIPTTQCSLVQCSTQCEFAINAKKRVDAKNGSLIVHNSPLLPPKFLQVRLLGPLLVPLLPEAEVMFLQGAVVVTSCAFASIYSTVCAGFVAAAESRVSKN